MVACDVMLIHVCVCYNVVASPIVAPLKDEVEVICRRDPRSLANCMQPPIPEQQWSDCTRDLPQIRRKCKSKRIFDYYK